MVNWLSNLDSMSDMSYSMAFYSKKNFFVGALCVTKSVITQRNAPIPPAKRRNKATAVVVVAGPHTA